MRRETEPMVDEKTTQRKIRGVARDMFNDSFTRQALPSPDVEVDYCHQQYHNCSGNVNQEIVSVMSWEMVVEE
ncbi:hypothetical protein Bca4012_084733 [Brassica carinata]